MALAYNNIARVYQAKDQFRKAESYFSSALSLFSNLGMESEKSTVLANIGKKSSQLSGDSRKAIFLLDSSTALAVKLNLRSQLEQNYLNLSDIYSGLGDFETSLGYYKLYSAIKDSVFNKETLSRLSDFQVKYEKEKDQAGYWPGKRKPVQDHPAQRVSFRRTGYHDHRPVYNRFISVKEQFKIQACF